jgi:ribA/ribD-fused uncharacterized protein
MPTVITEFRGQYHYLSNFYPVKVKYWATRSHASYAWWPTAEHAFQGAKCMNAADSRSILMAHTPGEAKALGRSVEIVPDWEQIKKRVMLEVLLSKFTEHPILRDQLVGTGPALLVEGNRWHDNYWGQCACHSCINSAGAWVTENYSPDSFFTDFVYTAHHPGKNYLGRLLMAARAVLE